MALRAPSRTSVCAASTTSLRSDRGAAATGAAAARATTTASTSATAAVPTAVFNPIGLHLHSLGRRSDVRQLDDLLVGQDPGVQPYVVDVAVHVAAQHAVDPARADIHRT